MCAESLIVCLRNYPDAGGLGRVALRPYMQMSGMPDEGPVFFNP